VKKNILSQVQFFLKIIIFLTVFFMAFADFNPAGLAKENVSGAGKKISTKINYSPFTLVRDKDTRASLLGEHGFSLQWISWNYFGDVYFADVDNTLFVYGKQEQKDGSDYLAIHGIVTEVDKTQFKFYGTIITQVSHINDGKPCKRDGNMTFMIKDNRTFWRLQEMLNPCDNTTTDYVDISR
jgi:hypothetical protein